MTLILQFSGASPRAPNRGGAGARQWVWSPQSSERLGVYTVRCLLTTVEPQPQIHPCVYVSREMCAVWVVNSVVGLATGYILAWRVTTCASHGSQRRDNATNKWIGWSGCYALGFTLHNSDEPELWHECTSCHLEELSHTQVTCVQANKTSSQPGLRIKELKCQSGDRQWRSQKIFTGGA